MRSRNIHLCMCVLLTSLHLIAILWKKFVLEGIVLFFALRPMFCVFIHYGIWAVCPPVDTRWRLKGIIQQLWNFFYSARMFMGSSACSCSMKTAWRQRAAESSGRGTLSRALEWAHTCWQSKRLGWRGAREDSSRGTLEGPVRNKTLPAEGRRPWAHRLNDRRHKLRLKKCFTRTPFWSQGVNDS